MEREQIIKALECCVKFECNKCPLTDGRCANGEMGRLSLSIIKELTEENERLSGAVKQYEEERKYHFEMSRTRIAEAKADTVRKMQERLKEAPIKVGLPLFGLQTKDEVEDYANGLILQMRDAIDQIAKEMLEGEE
jgi:hypothetical protein